MDLLNQIVRNPYDPDYAGVAAQKDTQRGDTRGDTRVSHRWLLAGVAALIGVLFAHASVQTTRSAPVLAGERQELIARIQLVERDQDWLRQRSTALVEEIEALGASVAGDDQQVRQQRDAIATLEPITGAVAVQGPGLSIVVDDAASGEDNRSDRVYDLDLQILANGLWQAGAEAIAINGHRLSALTAIRGAGEAITVNYRSLTRPYRVEVIGDPRTLQARFVESSGGVWWNELAANRSMRYDMTSVPELLVPADAGLSLRYAQRGT
jgi:uncharacterized protein YlxW (UPF0749 family)